MVTRAVVTEMRPHEDLGHQWHIELDKVGQEHAVCGPSV